MGLQQGALGSGGTGIEGMAVAAPVAAEVEDHLVLLPRLLKRGADLRSRVRLLGIDDSAFWSVL